MPMTTKTVVLVYERSVKHSHLFKAEAQGSENAINSAYINNSVFDGGKPPNKVKVTIEAA